MRQILNFDSQYALYHVQCYWGAGKGERGKGGGGGGVGEEQGSPGVVECAKLYSRVERDGKP